MRPSDLLSRAGASGATTARREGQTTGYEVCALPDWPPAPIQVIETEPARDPLLWVYQDGELKAMSAGKGRIGF